MKAGDEMVCVQAGAPRPDPITSKGIHDPCPEHPGLGSPHRRRQRRTGSCSRTGRGTPCCPSRFSKLADALTWTALVHKALDLADAPGTKDGQAR